MEISLNELLKGHSTLIKNKQYFSTEAYVTPFLERMSKFTSDFRIQAKLADQISLTEDDKSVNQDLIFNRVWIQAVLPDDLGYANHKECIGLVYGLDTRKPVMKIYRGGLNMACLNLCVFQPSFLNVQGLEPERAANYKCIEQLMSQTSDIKTTLEKLECAGIPYDSKAISERLGDWIRRSLNYSYSNEFGKVKLSTNTAIDAYKLLYEKDDSPYYVPQGESTDFFNIYNAWTQVITDDTRDIMNKVEKTFLIKDILGF